jgi:two-component system response regulator
MPQNSKIILLVEDNRDDEELVLRALKRCNIGNEVVVVRDGVEAIDYLFGTGAHAGRNANMLPSVVLLDLNLPKMGGLEVLQRLRANELTRFLPVVILTSSKEERDLFDGYRFGCNSYVRKPIDFVEFAEAIRNLGLFWIVLNELPPRKSS